MPPNKCLDGSRGNQLLKRFLAINNFNFKILFVSVQSHQNDAAVRSLKDHSLHGVAFCDLLDLDGIRLQKLAEVSQCVEHWLSVELVGGGVDNDGSVDEIADPIGAALEVLVNLIQRVVLS